MPVVESINRISHEPDWGWFAVHTHPRKEVVALDNLSRQGFESYLPRLKVQKVRRGRAVVIEEPLFARYLFVRLDTGMGGRSWAPIRSTLGVCRLVQFGDRPARVAPELVDWLKQRESQQAQQTLYEPGQRVLITQGPFAGLEALVQANTGEQRALILLEILSKPVQMSIDPALLRRA